jgi:hypothetical protein
MVDSDPFQERIAGRRRETEQAERDFLAGLDQAEVEHREGAERERREALESDYHGIDFGAVFSPEEAQLCLDFVEHMKRRRFSGSVLLIDQEPPDTRSVRAGFASRRTKEIAAPGEVNWSTRGYPIGVTQDILDETSGQFNVYVCGDGKLRILRRPLSVIDGRVGVGLGSLRTTDVRPLVGDWHSDRYSTWETVDHIPRDGRDESAFDSVQVWHTFYRFSEVDLETRLIGIATS